MLCVGKCAAVIWYRLCICPDAVAIYLYVPPILASGGGSCVVVFPSLPVSGHREGDTLFSQLAGNIGRDVRVAIPGEETADG